MIVDCAHYRDGVRQNEGAMSLEQAAGCRGEGSLVWIGLYEPSEQEMATAKRLFDLHELAVEDAQKAHQRPKLEEFGEVRFVVLHTARYDDAQERVHFGEVHLFVGPDYVIGVRHGEASELHSARHELEARPDLLRTGVGAIVWSIVDKVVDDYRPVVDGLENDIEEVQEAVFGHQASIAPLREWTGVDGRAGREERPDERDPAQRIYFLIREATEFQRAVHPLRAPLDMLEKGAFPQMDAEIRRYFRDVNDHVTRIDEEIRDQAKLLDSILQANLALVTVYQSVVVRKISAWAAIIAVPTFVASVYGMNFRQMPELDWVAGYPLAMALMLLVAGGLYLYFRRADWL